MYLDGRFRLLSFFSSCIHHFMNHSFPYKDADYQMNKLISYMIWNIFKQLYISIKIVAGNTARHEQ